MENAIFELSLRPVTVHPVDLEPRRVLGGPPAGPLVRRISLGEPILAPLGRPHMDHPSLDRYVLGMLASHEFFELHLVMTLYPEAGEPFEDAAVGVTFTGADEGNLPIAWSLFPLRSTVPVKVTNNLGISAKLGFVEPSAAHNTEYSRDDNFVLGLGERESSFEWRFRRTRTADLSGIHHMFAVVMAKKSDAFEVALVVSASVRRSKLGLARYRAKLPDTVGHVSWPKR
jgi:hypothetical protein